MNVHDEQSQLFCDDYLCYLCCVQVSLRYASCIRWTLWRPGFKWIHRTREWPTASSRRIDPRASEDSTRFDFKLDQTNYVPIYDQTLRISGIFSRHSGFQVFRYKVAGITGFMYFQGILPPILAETPKRATKFFTFEQYKNIFAIQGVSPAVVGDINVLESYVKLEIVTSVSSLCFLYADG